MTDNLDPKGPSQPSLQQGYETSGNPASKSGPEATTSASNQATSNNDDAPSATRVPQKQSTGIEQATPSSLGHGIHGAPAGEEAKGRTEEDVGRHNELDAEQMAAPGEGKVHDAVTGEKSGASGQEVDFASDLERKKAEQAPLRAKQQEEKEGKVDVAAALGQAQTGEGAPANPVGKGNYPNSGD